MSGLAVRGLCKSFGGLHVTRSVDLDLMPGDRKALIGPNGAGKSTLAGLITGTLAPTAGSIAFGGRAIDRLGEAARVRLGIAKTFQITTLFRNLSVVENLCLPILQRRKRAARPFSGIDQDTRAEALALLDAFAIAPFADRRVDTLAYGQQRLVELALTLALRPKVLILDEPAAGVPASDSHLIIDAIERLPSNLAVLIIEHDMDLVFRVARRVVVLVAGAVLVEGTPDEIGSDPRVRALYLGEDHG